MSGKLLDRSTIIMLISGFFCLFLLLSLSPAAHKPQTVMRLQLTAPAAALALGLLIAMRIKYQCDRTAESEDKPGIAPALQNSQQKDMDVNNRSYYTNAPVGLITIDWEKNVIVQANTRMMLMLGFDENGFPNTASELWANPLHFHQFVSEVKEKLFVQSYICELKSGSGKIINTEAFASMQKKSSSFEACFIDVSEKLQVLNFTKTQFLANMNHEIRTPMIGILGSVNLLEQSCLDRDQLDNVATIRECGEHLLDIINEILDVSRIELGVESLVFETCDLPEIFNQTVYLIEKPAKEKGLTVSMDLQESINSTVTTDPTKLRQILLNLLYNAIKFTNQGGIHIQARIDNQGTPLECLLASISDTGIGIDVENMQSIFEPFTQGDGSSSRIFGGTGLGLYICRRLVELLGGSIWAESKENQGTMFFFSIPVQTVHESDTLHIPSEESLKFTSSPDLALSFDPVQVLVVEDNRINHRIVSQMLVSYGFEVSTAEHGLECLRLMHEKQFDIVLMDMQMPVMDGYEATMYICSDPDLCSTPIIAMTAHAMAGDREKCLQCGCSDYIAKPFRTEELIKVINRNLKYSPVSHTVPDNSYDQLLEQLLPEFIDSLSDMLQDLHAAVDKRDIESVQSISHDIKGTAGMYGFKYISDLAAHLEQAAKDNKLHRVKSLSVNLYSLYEQLYQQVS